MKNQLFFAAVSLLAGCVSFMGDRDAEGFVRFDGTMPQEAPGEYFILRFERPDGVYGSGWQKGMTKWNFTEIRQLKSGSTIVSDGVLKPFGRTVKPCNWAKLICPGSRNVRIRFVDADYALEKDGVRDCPAGFVPLYNGRDLDGWEGMIPEEDQDGNGPEWRHALPPDVYRAKQAAADASMRKHWSIRDGVIFFDGLEGGTSIATKKHYRNFEMLVDWRLLRVYGDSGFYLRAMAQVQIWDPNTWGGQGSGGLWNNEKGFFGATSREDRPIGDWNTFRMRMVGDKVTVWVNGVKVVDAVPIENCWHYDLPIPAFDNIQLQCHGDPVEFRNIFIRELPDEAASTAIAPERIGVCSWSWKLPMREVIAQMERNGIKGVNLALMPFIENDKYHGGSETPETWQWLKEKVAKGDIKVMSTMISTVGEDYTTIESIARTGGIVPDRHWEANKVRFERGADLTKELGCRYLLTHAGFLDEDDPAAYAKYRERVIWIRDTCAKRGVVLILETGPDSADSLAAFMPTVPGVFLNFDPANMIQWNKGRPMEALDRLIPWIRQVHVKDAHYSARPGEWGGEVPWGDGEVGGKAFVAALEKLGFTGNYVIEREEGENRVADIVLARKRLTE